jgi:hypothetical protein
MTEEFNFQWKEPIRGGQSGKHIGRDSIYISMAGSGRGDRQLSIRIYEGVMEKMRWVCGDRVSVGYDSKAKKIAIKRIPSGGYKLSASTANKKDRIDSVGKSVKSIVKMAAAGFIDDLKIEPVSVMHDQCLDVDGMLIIPLEVND